MNVALPWLYPPERHVNRLRRAGAQGGGTGGLEHLGFERVMLRKASEGYRAE